MKRLLYGIALFLSACQPMVQPSPQPTSRILTITVTETLQGLRTDFATCALQAGVSLVVVAAAQDPALKRSALELRWGPAEGQSYAAVIAKERLVLAVHPQNPAPVYSLEELKSLFLGRPAGELASIHAWSYPQGTDIQEVIESTLLGDPLAGLPPQVARTYLAPGPEEMRAAIARDPQAVGFLPYRWLDSSVQPVEIKGINPALLEQPVLAVSPSEPAGIAREWLLCLQSRLSTEEIHEH